MADDVGSPLDENAPVGDERELRDAVAILLEPPSLKISRLVIVATGVLFVAAQMTLGIRATTALVLVGVILFHELGHLAGMRAFGYRDVTMFFIPFFGAAAAGRREGIAAWKDGVVTLLGPVPGIIAGLVVAVAGSENPLLRDLAWTLVGVNLFNLLPLGPLDGGRLFHRILFSRHRFLEVTFAAIGGLLVILLGLTTGSWALSLLGWLVLWSATYRHKLLGVAAAFTAVHPDMPSDPARLTPEERWQLFVFAREGVPDRARSNAAVVGSAMRDILDTRLPAPSIGASLLLFAAWAAAIVLSIDALGGLYATEPPVWAERPCAEIGVSAMFPGDPETLSVESETPFGTRTAHRCFLAHPTAGFYAVEMVNTGRHVGPDEQRDWIRANTATQAGALPSPLEVRGMDAVDLRVGEGDETLRVRIIFAGYLVYELQTLAPDSGDAQRFLDSFRPLRARP